jgi:hypothetical protein
MVYIPDDFENSGNRASAGGASNSGQLERVHELTWELFDEQITDHQMTELESLLLNDKTARDAYIQCVMLHADLTSHFATPASGQPAPSKTSKSPVLGFLNEAMPPMGLPSAEELK